MLYKTYIVIYCYLYRETHSQWSSFWWALLSQFMVAW